MFYHQIRKRGLLLKSFLEKAALCLLAAECRTVRSCAILVWLPTRGYLLTWRPTRADLLMWLPTRADLLMWLLPEADFT